MKKLTLLFIMLSINYLNAQIWTTYTFGDNDIKSLAIDSKGNKWACTSSGVFVLNTDCSQKTSYTTNNGLIFHYVDAIAIDANDVKWFGTSFGISRFDDTTWTNYTNYNFYGDNYVHVMFCDWMNRIWAGADGGYTSNFGLSLFNENSWINYGTSNGLAGNCVFGIKSDKQNNLWIGTNGGVSKFDGVNWTSYNQTNGLAENDVIAIAIDSVGNKWFGTKNGLSRFDGVNWTNFLIGTQILSIGIDKNGVKWIGTYFGVYRFDNVNWTSFNTTNCSIAGNVIQTILFDSSNNIWFATDKGLSRLSNLLNSTSKISFEKVISVTPTTDKITINSKILSRSCTFELLDIRGSVVLKTEISNSQNSVSLIDFAKGLYLFRVVDNSNIIYTGKIVRH